MMPESTPSEGCHDHLLFISTQVACACTRAEHAAKSSCRLTSGGDGGTRDHQRQRIALAPKPLAGNDVRRPAATAKLCSHA